MIWNKSKRAFSTNIKKWLLIYKKRGIWLNNYQTVAKEYAGKPSYLEVTNEMFEFKSLVLKFCTVLPQEQVNASWK